jgi:hypothetical protein
VEPKVEAVAPGSAPREVVAWVVTELRLEVTPVMAPKDPEAPVKELTPERAFIPVKF